MSEINNGGPAFPTLAQCGDMALADGGITVRDYFAAKALQAAMQSPVLLDSVFKLSKDVGAGKNETLASFSYDIADSMLAEREKGGAA